MSIEKLFFEFAKTTQGLSEDEVKQIIYENPDDEEPKLRKGAAKDLVTRDANRIKKIKEEAEDKVTTAFDDGAKKREAIIKTKFDNDFIAKTGYKGDKQGMEAVMDHIQHIQKGNLGDPEKVKMSPTFIEAEKKWKQEKEEAENKWKGELEEFKGKVNKDKTMGVVKEKALKVFLGQNPVLSQNPDVAENQKKTFLSGFDNMEFTVQGEGDKATIIPMRDGKRLETENGHPIEFEGLVKERTQKLFDLKVQDGKDTISQKGKVKVGKTELDLEGVKVPQSLEERNKMINAAKTNEEVVKIQAAWKQSPAYTEKK